MTSGLLSAFLVLLSLHVVSCRVLAAEDPIPGPWPDSFFATLARNGTKADGSFTGTDVQAKYYDYSNRDAPLYRQDCSKNGITSTFLLLAKEGYIFTKASDACVHVTLPVAVVKPSWMQGGDYQGTEVVNNVPSNLWIKADHRYYESVTAPKRPTRVFTPFDQLGTAHQEDYGTFAEVQHAPGTFDIPAYCPAAPALSLLNTTPELAAQGVLSIARGLGATGGVGRAVDPAGCFI